MHSVTDKYTISCHHCQKTVIVDRDPTDPVSSVRAEIICPDCDDGDFDFPKYFDKDGNEVEFDQ